MPTRYENKPAPEMWNLYEWGTTYGNTKVAGSGQTGGVSSYVATASACREIDSARHKWAP
jgi:hypothetical protein